MLNQSEVNELYTLPNFNRTDREDYFSLDNETKALVSGLRQTETDHEISTLEKEAARLY